MQVADQYVAGVDLGGRPRREAMSAAMSPNMSLLVPKQGVGVNVSGWRPSRAKCRR